MKNPIAVVGMACQYPDARTPDELWDNVLAQRRAFRRLPPERMRDTDYLAERSVEDTTYVLQGAVIEGYEFDRARYRVPVNTYRQADLAHWLALDVASQALADAGYPEATDLPLDMTGVLIGNTLTGEFSRANLMRLRWPYVRRVLDATLAEENLSPERRRDFLARLEARYKAPFPVVGDETLAGGLSNTIAGRICNHYDLHGGGYTVDGACASSLLAIANACSALAAGDLDVALAGGVDLSLDPFEIIGFAKVGALAPSQMRVYDLRSQGFWPGEGCGIVVLMRHEDAVATGRRVYATVCGWGMSSDGSGGLTRPEVAGQRLAVQRAYARAGYGANRVSYFEGHGTGTAVGDPTELRVLSESIRSAGRVAGVPAAVGSIKANIGHTKAAAGVAGFIKATLALHHRTLPPNTACEQPQAEFARPDAVLRVLPEAEAWPEGVARAGCSAMGFGGINTHVTLEGVSSAVADNSETQRAVVLSRSAQDSELFCLSGTSTDDLGSQVEHLLGYAAHLSLSDLTDLAVTLARRARPTRLRAAVVASTATELEAGLRELARWLADGIEARLAPQVGVYLGASGRNPPARIGLLFPGQASPSYFDAGVWRRHFPGIDRLYRNAALSRGSDPKATEVAQPAICCAARAGLLALAECNVDASVAIGHSVGELPALHWAGVLDAETLLAAAAARGRAMAQHGVGGGAMASLRATTDRVRSLLGRGAVVAGVNSTHHTVIAGDAEPVRASVERAKLAGIETAILAVSHAFHSPHMQPVATHLRRAFAGLHFAPPVKRVISTVTGRELGPEDDLREILQRQLTDPVLFATALAAADNDVDLWIEAGPGRVLTGLVQSQSETPVIALDASSPSLAGLLHACGAAFALGKPVRIDRLFAGRFARDFHLDWQPRFFVNPCELAPVRDATVEVTKAATPPTTRSSQVAQEAIEGLTRDDPLEVFRQIVSQHLELPAELVRDDSHLLTDLHLNSITVGQLVGQASRKLGLPGPGAATEYATSTVGEVGQALAELRQLGAAAPAPMPDIPAGIEAWVRAFEHCWVEAPLVEDDSAKETRASQWTLLTPPDHTLAAPLRETFAEVPGAGVVVCMPQSAVQCNVDDLLRGARLALQRDVGRLVIVQHAAEARGAAPGASFAKTLHLEAPRVRVCIVDVPIGEERAPAWVAAEARSTRSFSEARYDRQGRRWEPRLRLLQHNGMGVVQPLTPKDVVLVSGGGKGIAAECALALATRSGAALGLVGRSDPEHDDLLRDNLQRLRDAGVRFHYAIGDVCDAAQVRNAVHAIEDELGSVTAIVHGAGTNVPQPIAALDEAACIRTLQPKVQGLQHLLLAVSPERLRLLVTFSSIIGRCGLPGEADYALANEWLTSLTRRFAAEYRQCQCLALEWSVWSGVGMGQRLGRIDTLQQRGISAITPQQGVEALLQLLQQPLSDPAVVVTGRFGAPPTLRFEIPEWPLLRFVEKPCVHYPGVELVVEVELSGTTDPYVDEHVYQRQPLFPAVMGLEAMAQVAAALSGRYHLPVFEDVELHRPIVVPKGGTQVLQIAALLDTEDSVRVAVRCGDTDFKLDHFRAVCRFEANEPIAPLSMDQSGTDVDPARDLYDAGTLFHQGRFRRLAAYEQLRARECHARLHADSNTQWFGRFLPETLQLGDAAARDAAIHAIQACIPHLRLLPVAVERIVPGCLDGSAAQVRARERCRDAQSFTYDMEILDAAGQVLETWQGLRLQQIERIRRDTWGASLLGAYLERRAQELFPDIEVRIALQCGNGGDRHHQSDRAVQQALGAPVSVARRPDGKPELAGTHRDLRDVSVAHAAGLTLAVVGQQVGCDLEPVLHREASSWQDLCGVEHMKLARLIATQAAEDIDSAATRVWAALESLKKAGASAAAPLLLEATHEDGCVILRSGGLMATTHIASVLPLSTRVATALAVAAPRP